MKFRRVLTILLILVPMLAASAQDQSLIDRFYAGVADSCLDISYSYSARVSGILNNGQGHLCAQGLMWRVKGNGVEMYCDSKSLWIIDRSMKEAVIEPAADENAAEWLSNPALIFSQLQGHFKVSESISVQGGQSVIFVLKPLDNSGITYCNLELMKSDASIKNATVALSDGTLIKIEVSSMKLTPKVSVEAFRPHIDFDSSWILTDLR